MHESDIFMAALEFATPEERTAYLDETCSYDSKLRQRVEALLQAHMTAGSLLEHPALEGATVLFQDTEENAEPQPHPENHADFHVDVPLDFLTPCDKPDCLGTLGQYEITEVLGRGGMGVVLKAVDTKLNRTVAVKVLAPELASNPMASRRFSRESHTAAAVTHDHVVRIYAVDDTAELPFLVMECIDGMSLQQKIDKRGALELKEILRIGMQMAAGLAAAHSQGLVHRDIKPSNILLENGVEQVKITDFGLARAVDDVGMTQTGQITGTPLYMAPEQAHGETIDHRADLFGLGSVLYAMCTGRAAFRADTTMAVLKRVCEDTPRPIREVSPDIPDWLVEIIGQLLEKQPVNRFQTADEVAELLRQHLAYLQHPTNAPPPGLVRRRPVSVDAGRSRRWLVAGATLLIACAALGVTEATGVTEFASSVISIVRGDGTLVIEVNDPAVSVTIEGEDVVITGAGPKEVRLKPGNYRLQASKEGKPVRMKQQLVTIVRGDRQVVRVTLKAESVASVERQVDKLQETVEPKVGEAAEAQSRLVGTFPSATGYPKSLAISPDGRHFVFQDAESASLVVRDLKTGEDRQLASIVVPVERPNIVWQFHGQSIAISRDGKWVAYNVYDEKDNTAELRIIGIDGTQGRTVFDPEDPVQWISPKDWSPDGKQIVGRIERSDGTRGIVMVAVTDGSVKELKSLGKLDSENMSLSPDGRYIAYDFHTGNHRQEDIALLPVDGGPEVSVIEHPADDDLLGWSPDGRTLLFRSNRRIWYGAWAIQIIDGKPQGLPQLVKNRTNESTQILNGRFTRDGSFYYSTLDTGGPRQNVYVAAIDPDSRKLSAPPKPLPERVNQRAISPEFSADGKYLAYYVAPNRVRSDQGERYGPGNIVIRSLETGQEREVILSPKFSDGGSWPRIRWHPNGRSALMLGRNEAGRFALFQVDMETGALTTLKLNPGEVDWQLRSYGRRAEGDNSSWGEYSPDGTAVYFGHVHFNPNAPNGDLRTDWRVIKRDLNTGTETEICRNPEGKVGFCNLTVSPDGKRLLIGTKNSLWIVPTTGGEPRELLKTETWKDLVLKKKRGFSSRIKWRVTWTPDSRHLLFLKGGKQGPELWRIAAEGGKPELLDTLPASLGRATRSIISTQELRIHPDGRRIAFVASKPAPMELRVLENLLPELATSPVQLPNPPKGNYFVARSEDDAEEYRKGSVYVSSADLDLGQMDSGNAGDTIVVGIRLDDISIPKGAKIMRAFLQFTKDDSDVEAKPSKLTIHAELSGNAKSFTEVNHNISSRKKTKSSVIWQPEPWKVGWERSEKHQSPDLSSLVQEVVAQDGWKKGNALVLIITGTGERDTISFDGGKQYAPMLHVDY